MINICLYGHVRRKYFFFHFARVFPNAKFFIHTWDEFQPQDKTWHGLDQHGRKLLGDSYLKLLARKLDISSIEIESQENVPSIPVGSRKFHSALRALLQCQKDQFVLMTRPDIVFDNSAFVQVKKVFHEGLIPDKTIICGFDLAPSRKSVGTESFGATDLLVIGKVENLITIFEVLKNMDEYIVEKSDDFVLMMNAAKGLGIRFELIGLINERDFFIWRWKQRWRFRNLRSVLKDIISCFT